MTSLRAAGFLVTVAMVCTGLYEAPLRGEIVVGPFDLTPPGVLVFADGAAGNTPPTRAIQGPLTGFASKQSTSLAADGVHREIWAAGSSEVEVFSAQATGNTAPLRRFNSASLIVVAGIALDLVHDEVVVGSYDSGTNDAIVVFPRTANGTVTPLRRIAGPATGIQALYGVAVDPRTNEIYAVVNGPGFVVPAILVFSRTATGNVAPLRKISGAATLLAFPFGLAVDPVHDELAVIDFGGPAIRVFARGANGNVAPLRSIAGASTGLEAPRGLALLGDDEILVANGANGPAPNAVTDNAVLAFPRAGSGNIAPRRILGGPATLLKENQPIAVYHPALLVGGGRFAAEVTWRTPNGNVGEGSPNAITADTGDFWFFDSSNIEAVVKVLNGCASNQRFWVFAGGLTNVAASLKVTDLRTGAVKVYSNPQNKPFQPIQDTSAFATCSVADADAETALDAMPSIPAPDIDPPAALGPACSGLCLTGGRFQVTANWQTTSGSGSATGVALTTDTGYLWFFGATNVEVVVKVLNGCVPNHHYWVFAGGLTNVKVDLTVRDTLTGTSRTYHNLQNHAFQPVQDVTAFATCP